MRQEVVKGRFKKELDTLSGTWPEMDVVEKIRHAYRIAGVHMAETFIEIMNTHCDARQDAQGDQEDCYDKLYAHPKFPL